MIRMDGTLDGAESRDREVKAVTSTISHELRTPLNAIIGFSELIQEEDSLNEIKNFAQIIQLNGSLLLNKIHSIIDFSVLDYYRDVCLEGINFKELIFNVYEEFIKEAKTTNSVQIEIGIPENDKNFIIYSDKIKIKKILTNLLSNALKFTKEGRIEIGYKISKENNTPGKLLIYVSDTGIGIPLDKQNIIFKPFRQVDESYCANLDGLGIGLAICDKLSKILDGKIWVESKLDKGVVFYLELPVNELFSTKNTLLKKMNILIVEENDKNYFQIKECLDQDLFNILRTPDLKYINGLLTAISDLDYIVIFTNTMLYGSICNIQNLSRNYPYSVFIIPALNIYDFATRNSNADNLYFIKTPLDKDEFKNIIFKNISKKMIFTSD